MKEADGIGISLPMTFLSPQVHHFLVDVGAQDSFGASMNGDYIDENISFKWEQIEPLIGNISEDFNIHQQTSEWFEEILSRLVPVLAACHKYLGQRKKTHSSLIQELSSWTKKEEELLEAYNTYLSSDSTSTVEVPLLLTAILERALGNVLLLNGKQVPFLLRDLLSTSELKTTLGIFPIIFLQVLLGTPQCLNLRNVVWHGFPSPDEIHPHYSATLLVSVCSVGKLLQGKGIMFSSIPSREQTKFKKMEVLNENFPDIHEHKRDAMEIIDYCSFIPLSHKVYWKTAVEYYCQNRYGRSLLLLLPQMEQTMRIAYCLANNCPDRVLTAESTVFYTTMDEVLSPFTSGEEENRIRNLLGEPLLEMLHDLFVHLAGPRIRDKISHGECNLCDIPFPLCNAVIAVALTLIIQCSSKNASEQVLPDSFQNGILVSMLRKSQEGYISKFNLSSLVAEDIRKAFVKLNEWKNFPLPDRNMLTYKTWDEVCDERKDFLCLKSMVVPHVLHIILRNEGEVDISDCLKVRVLTLYRDKVEYEFLSFLKRLAGHVGVTCENVQNGMKIKFNLFQGRKLRSRQRVTYCRMLEIVPVLHLSVTGLLLVTVYLWQHVNDIPTWSEERRHDWIRFLKFALHYVENIASYTSTERNRWDEAASLTDAFCKQALQKLPHLIE